MTLTWEQWSKGVNALREAGKERSEYLEKNGDNIVKNMSEFKKFDQGKLEWNLMPEPALEEVMKVLQYGKSKYGDWNWLDNSDNVSWTRYLNALERHLKKFKKGQNLDEESRLYELAHIACNSLMLLQYQIQNTGIDDRKVFNIKEKINETEYLNKQATEKLTEHLNKLATEKLKEY